MIKKILKLLSKKYWVDLETMVNQMEEEKKFAMLSLDKADELLTATLDGEESWFLRIKGNDMDMDCTCTPNGSKAKK